jgi:hypothetical protein
MNNAGASYPFAIRHAITGKYLYWMLSCVNLIIVFYKEGINSFSAKTAPHFDEVYFMENVENEHHARRGTQPASAMDAG